MDDPSKRLTARTAQREIETAAEVAKAQLFVLEGINIRRAATDQSRQLVVTKIALPEVRPIMPKFELKAPTNGR